MYLDRPPEHFLQAIPADRQWEFLEVLQNMKFALKKERFTLREIETFSGERFYALQHLVWSMRKKGLLRSQRRGECNLRWITPLGEDLHKQLKRIEKIFDNHKGEES